MYCNLSVPVGGVVCVEVELVCGDTRAGGGWSLQANEEDLGKWERVCYEQIGCGLARAMAHGRQH